MLEHVPHVERTGDVGGRNDQAETPAIAVFRLEDGFYATEDTCSHAQSSLAAGDVDLEECTVECPYHASQFEIKTGRVLSLPATKPIRTFPVRIVGDEVYVETD